jgi:hypothetical protein
VKRLLEQGGPPLALWLTLFWLWLLLAGEWNRIELIAAAAAATAASALAELVRRRARLRLSLPPRAWTAPLMVFVDFGVLAYVLLASLARRRIARGVYRANPLPRQFSPAAVTLLATYSPNAYVVEIDSETGTALVHDLVPLRASERPA